MADQGFTITLDTARGLMRVAMQGFWDQATVTRYRQERVRASDALARAGTPLHRQKILVDRRGQSVQSQEVVTLFEDLAADFAKRAERVAVLVSSALHRRQIDRMNLTAGARIFDSEDAALSWLFSS